MAQHLKVDAIGWGSLLWNPGALHCSGGWQRDGPDLGIELARTSRDGRLTLELVEAARAAPTLWAELDYASPTQAQEALAGREACDVHSIGLWPGKPPRHAPAAAAIAAWTAERRLDAVVWTALPPKFNGIEGTAPASEHAAIDCLRSLPGPAQTAARRYVERIPSQVRTAFRSAIEAELGWLPGTE
jgi:hypothetical protein